MRSRVSLLLLALAAAGLAGRAPAAPDGVRVDTGEIDGAKYTIARPAGWNGCLLLHAHGQRDARAPLVADLNPHQLAYQTLLGEGWMIAVTSFRRNGLVIRDAISDLENLRAAIARQYGEPQIVILEGSSMGGAIVTLMAEQFADHYQGAVAVGAALQAREPGGSLAFTLQPRIPLVFLSNQGELDGPRRYLAAPFDRPIQPVLLEVKRDGHVNVNQRELLTAIRTVLKRIDGQPPALPAIEGAPGWYDATQTPTPGPSQVRLLNEGGFEARIAEVSAVYGNVTFNAQPLDMAQAAIAPGARFEMTAHGRTFRVLYGRDFSSVPRGGWVAFPDADGFLLLARNQEDAAATAGLAAGDVVVIHRILDDSAGDSGSAPP